MENEQYLQPTDLKQQWMNKVNTLIEAVDNLPSEGTGGISTGLLGDLSKLTTLDKTSLVRAINSLKSELQGQLTSLVTDVNGVEAQQESNVSAINSLSNSLSNMLLELEQLEATIPDISALETSIGTLSSKSTALEGLLAGIRTEINDLTEDEAVQKGTIDSLESDVSELFGTTESLVTQQGVTDGKVTTLEQSSGTQQTKITQIENKQNSMDTLQGSQFEDITKLKTDVSTLNTTVSGVVSSVASHTESLSKQTLLLADLSKVSKRLGRKYKQSDTVDTMRLADWANMVGVSTKDTEFVRRGSESIRITSSVAGEQPFIRSSRTLKLQGITNVEIVFYLHNDPADIDSIVVFLSNNSGFTNALSVTYPQIALVQGWNRLVVPVSKMTVVGTGTVATDMIRTQIKLIPLAGKIGSMTIDSVAVDHRQQANILFTFDDQWDTQYSVAFAEMRMRGLKGSIGVNASTVGTASFMTWAQLTEVFGYGWDMVNHTNTHINLGQSLRDVQKSDIETGRQALVANGFAKSADVLFYPYGSYNSDTISVLQELGITYARTIREHMEYPEPIQPTALKIKNLLPVVTAASAQALVDDAISTGGTLIFLAHRLGTEDASNMFWDIAKFTALLNYVKTKQISGEVKVLTMTEWISTFN